MLTGPRNGELSDTIIDKTKRGLFGLLAGGGGALGRSWLESMWVGNRVKNAINAGKSVTRVPGDNSIYENKHLITRKATEHDFARYKEMGRELKTDKFGTFTEWKNPKAPLKMSEGEQSSIWKKYMSKANPHIEDFFGDGGNVAKNAGKFSKIGKGLGSAAGGMIYSELAIALVQGTYNSIRKNIAEGTFKAIKNQWNTGGLFGSGGVTDNADLSKVFAQSGYAAGEALIKNLGSLGTLLGDFVPALGQGMIDSVVRLWGPSAVESLHKAQANFGEGVGETLMNTTDFFSDIRKKLYPLPSDPGFVDRNRKMSSVDISKESKVAASMIMSNKVIGDIQNSKHQAPSPTTNVVNAPQNVSNTTVIASTPFTRSLESGNLVGSFVFQ
jgi:hypothetical protein